MKKSFKLLIIIFVVVFLLGSIGLVWTEILRDSQEAKLQNLAVLLDYQESNKIAQVRRCWDINSHCGIFLHFTTGLSLSELDSKISALPYPVNYTDNIRGYGFFTDINMGTSREITYNGNNGIPERDMIPEPNAKKYVLNGEKPAEWVISLYELTPYQGSYQVGGQNITGNLITILLIVK